MQPEVKQDKLQTKHSEIIETVSLITEMKGKYLAERLLRGWKEDFTDEDTGEVVTIDRHELIHEKGTYLSNDVLSEINFLLQSGDITEVKVSNQNRSCTLKSSHASVWVVAIELNAKKRNIYLYANSIDTATNITIDYVEQRYVGSFKICSVKELDFSNLLDVQEEEEDPQNDTNYYKIEAEVTNDDGESHNQNFILKASDADKAKSLIVYQITKLRQEKGDGDPFEVTVISAKKIPCNDVVCYEFSKQYLEQ